MQNAAFEGKNKGKFTQTGRKSAGIPCNAKEMRGFLFIVTILRCAKQIMRVDVYIVPPFPKIFLLYNIHPSVTQNLRKPLAKHPNMCYYIAIKKVGRSEDRSWKKVPKYSKCLKKAHLLHRKLRFVNNFQEKFFRPPSKQKTAEIA